MPGDVDAVLHLASPASPADFERIPIQILKVGSLGTHNCLGLAKAKGARFFLASTSEVYGDPLVHPQPETYWGNVNPIGPRGVYDEAKRFAEAMTMAYHRHHGLDVRIVRIFNTYGAAMRPDDGRAVSNFLVQALEGKPITVYGDGRQTRTFTYVDDEIRGFLALLDSDDHHARQHRQPRRVHDPRAGRARPSRSRARVARSCFEPLPVDDPTQRQPDITLARELLGLGADGRRCARASSAPPTYFRRAPGRLAPAVDRRASSAGKRALVGVGLVEGGASCLAERRHAPQDRRVPANRRDEPSTSPLRRLAPAAEARDGLVDVAADGPDVEDGQPGRQVGVELRRAHHPERAVVEGDERQVGAGHHRGGLLLGHIAAEHDVRSSPRGADLAPRAQAQRAPPPTKTNSASSVSRSAASSTVSKRWPTPALPR